MQARSEKIAEEEDKCRVMAENAQHDLDEALPALAEATKALESLNKKDMTEIKSYGRPPALVEKVMEAVMILRGGEPTWAEAKRQLGKFRFESSLSTVIRLGYMAGKETDELRESRANFFLHSTNFLFALALSLSTGYFQSNILAYVSELMKKYKLIKKELQDACQLEDNVPHLIRI